MSLATGIAVSVGFGLLGGALAGFVVAVLSLKLCRLRNARLAARGFSGYRDLVLPLVFVPLVALVAALTSGTLSVWLPVAHAVVIGVAAPAALLLAIQIWRVLSQLRSPEFPLYPGP